MAQAVAASASASASSVGEVQLQIDALKEQVGKLNALLATGVDDSDGQLASMRDTLYVAFLDPLQAIPLFAAQHTLTVTLSQRVMQPIHTGYVGGCKHARTAREYRSSSSSSSINNGNVAASRPPHHSPHGVAMAGPSPRFRYHAAILYTSHTRSVITRSTSPTGSAELCPIRVFRHVETVSPTDANILAFWLRPRSPAEVYRLSSSSSRPDAQLSLTLLTPLSHSPVAAPVQKACHAFQRGSCPYQRCRFSHGIALHSRNLTPFREPDTAKLTHKGAKCYARYNDGVW